MLIAIGLLMTIAAGEQGDDGVDDRFQFFNECEAIGLVVAVANTSPRIELTEARVRTAAEARLRAARVYTDLTSTDQFKGAFAIQVNVVGEAVSFEAHFVKQLFDPISTLWGPGVTWTAGQTGTYGADFGSTMQAISEIVDEFLVKFLRANETAC